MAGRRDAVSLEWLPWLFSFPTRFFLSSAGSFSLNFSKLFLCSLSQVSVVAGTGWCAVRWGGLAATGVAANLNVDGDYSTSAACRKAENTREEKEVASGPKQNGGRERRWGAKKKEKRKASVNRKMCRRNRR